MRAWCLPKQGTIDSLSLESIAATPPAPGEVVLDVRYAALNPADRYLAEGQYPARPTFPHVLGRDGVGTVTRVGEGVSEWRPGDTALLLRGEAGVSRPGTLAEQVTVPAACLAHVPAGWTEQEAAAAPLVSLTAWQSLTQWGDLPPGVVLVSGASGGVGVATVQLAIGLGHTVLGLSRSREKAARLAEIGAAAVFDPADPGWWKQAKAFLAPRRVDLVVDTIGGALLPQLIDMLGLEGRVSLVGMLAGPVPQFNTASCFFRRIRLGGVAVGGYSFEESHAAWRRVVAVLAAGGQRPLIDSVWPLERVPEAFARLAAGPLGKVLVDMHEAIGGAKLV